MENLDITILTSVLAIAFLVFLIATYKEFRHMNVNPYESNKRGEAIVQLNKLVDKIFADKSISKTEKKIIADVMDKTIADMETDGVYFSDEVRKALKTQSEELNCEYSGLPSPKSFETKK
jgi:hypothetical protein